MQAMLNGKNGEPRLPGVDSTIERRLEGTRFNRKSLDKGISGQEEAERTIFKVFWGPGGRKKHTRVCAKSHQNGLFLLKKLRPVLREGSEEGRSTTKVTIVY